MDLRGIIVCLPDAPLDDHLGAVEVLIQEGFSSFALPVGGEALADVIAIFGARARFGALRVQNAADVATAVAAGATFLLADLPDPVLLGAAAEAGVLCLPAAMTPTEVRAVLAAGAEGALLYPADVVGHALAGRLAELGLADRVVPLGGMGAYAAGEWAKSGAPAVCVDTTLIGDAYAGGSLSQLRDRCGSFTAVEERMRQEA